MIKKILIVILVLFTLSSCSLDDGNSNFNIETLPIKEAIVPTEFEFGQLHTLKVTFDLPNGCHSFHSLFYQRDDTSRIVAINSLVNNDIACTEIIIEKEFEFEVRATQEEDYIFKFWKGTDNNGDDIFEEVIVPVNP